MNIFATLALLVMLVAFFVFQNTVVGFGALVVAAVVTIVHTSRDGNPNDW